MRHPKTISLALGSSSPSLVGVTDIVGGEGKSEATINNRFHEGDRLTYAR